MTASPEDVAIAFARMIEEGRRIAAAARWWREHPALAEMAVDELKALWDAYDGSNSPGGFEGEDIHLALNLRGEGSYCAV